MKEEGEFMTPMNIIQSLLKQEKMTETKSLTFRQGQIFTGKVLKLYPNQIAEVQVGSQKVIAQLETPLSVNDRHWFQVQAGEGKIHLKVLETPSGNGKLPIVEDLLKQLNLSISKDNLSLLQFFLKERLPIMEDIIQASSKWLETSDSLQEGLQALKIMLSKQLPFTKDVFLSLTSAIQNESLSTLLENLQLQIKHSQPENTKLLSLVNEISMTEKEKTNHQVIAQIVKEWLSTTDKSAAAFKLLQSLGFIPKNVNEEAIINQAVEKWLNKEINLPSSHAGKSAEAQLLGEIIEHNRAGNRGDFILSLTKLLLQMKTNTTANNQNKAINNIQQLLAEVKSNQLSVPINANSLSLLGKEMFRTLFAELNTTHGQNTATLSNQSILSFMSIEGADTDQAFMQLAKVLSNVDSKQFLKLSNEEQSLLINIRKDTQFESVKWENPQTVKEQMQNLIKTLGLTYEHDAVKLLKHHEGENITKIETLKPLLIQLLREETPFQIKDTAEKLLYKITGFQVLSQEVGPIQQYVFQIPISFWNKKTDLTMQWSGRKTDNGKIDANFCRVLFYLNLEYLQETIVDLQVQNRVMNISIINERNDIKMFATPLIANLKEGLAKIDYHLSSVTFEKSAANRQINEKKDTLSSILVPNKFSGVDFRI